VGAIRMKSGIIHWKGTIAIRFAQFNIYDIFHCTKIDCFCLNIARNDTRIQRAELDLTTEFIQLEKVISIIVLTIF